MSSTKRLGKFYMTDRRGVEFVCETANPPTTRSEARAIARERDKRDPFHAPHTVTMHPRRYNR